MSKRSVLVFVVTMLLVIGAYSAISEFDPLPLTGNSRVTSYETGTAYSTSSHSEDGLTLNLALDATGIQSGQGVSITVDEENPLPRLNVVSASNDWPIGTNIPTVDPCGNDGLPIEWAMAQGYLMGDNVSAASWLDIYKPVPIVYCPVPLSGVTAYAFQASSDIASWQSTTRPISTGGDFSGWWNGSTFSTFAPGVYTVVAADEWGALALLHFNVEAPGQRPTYYSTTSSQGLRLQAQLNASTIYARSTLAAHVSLSNTLDENLSLVPSYSANSTLSNWKGYDYFCAGSSSPLASILGYALFEGDYSASNVSLAGNPMQLAPPVDTGCVTYPYPDSITFLPGSDNIVVSSPDNFLENATLAASTASCTTPHPATFECGPSGGLSGYWNTPGVTSITSQQAEIGSKYFEYLSPGEYTLAVQDVWGQSLYVHFYVSGPSP